MYMISLLVLKLVIKGNVDGLIGTVESPVIDVCVVTRRIQRATEIHVYSSVVDIRDTQLRKRRWKFMSIQWSC
jgi:hypothetical protein